jgi:hypothetical protein
MRGSLGTGIRPIYGGRKAREPRGRSGHQLQLRRAAALFVGEDGKVYVRPALVRDIQAFARIWDLNLKHQGFVDAAGVA